MSGGLVGRREAQVRPWDGSDARQCRIPAAAAHTSGRAGMGRKFGLIVGLSLAVAWGSLAPAAHAADCAVGGFVVNKRTGIVEQLLAF